MPIFPFAFPAIFQPFFRRLLAERRCVSCLVPFVPEPGDAADFLRLAACPACAARLRRLAGGFCTRCGEILPDAGAKLCGPCAAAGPDAVPWKNFRLYGAYEGPLRELLLRAKFHSYSAAIETAGNMLTEVCSELLARRPDSPDSSGEPDSLPDAVIPMPLHPERLRARGCNQCVEMARPLAKRLGIPLLNGVLERIKATAPQSSLALAERAANVRGVFEASARLAAGKHFLLVDDIATTNNTLREAAEALLNAGCVRVDVAVVAKTRQKICK